MIPAIDANGDRTYLGKSDTAQLKRALPLGDKNSSKRRKRALPDYSLEMIVNIFDNEGAFMTSNTFVAQVSKV